MRPEWLARHALLIRASGELPDGHPECGAPTKGAQPCKFPEGYCPWHGPKCGLPTKAGNPCQTQAVLCSAHRNPDELAW